MGDLTFGFLSTEEADFSRMASACDDLMPLRSQELRNF